MSDDVVFMDARRLYIHTIGCQMNVYDSGRIARGLAAQNYHLTADIHTADLVIVNTCAIRGKAEQKVFSFLGRLAKLKREKPSLLIGVAGCVAQQQGERIVRRVPQVNLVFGPDAIGRLPAMVHAVEQDPSPLVDVGGGEAVEPAEPFDWTEVENGISRFVTIMKGCDNFCTYCVVPFVRGREQSRHPDNILAEIRNRVRHGVVEVTLLGQNVNSYGTKEGLCSFAELLSRIDAVEGLKRIRFTTSHPKDLSPDLCRAFAQIDKLCRHIHLPVQSGSDRILRRMNRRYSREDYLAKVHLLREACPDIAITSDFIVGFPGESDADFQNTLELMQTVQYDSVFAFKYSDRPEAPSRRFADKVGEKTKEDRLKQLLAHQEAITLKKNRSLVGSRQEVLVEGFSRKQTALAAEGGACSTSNAHRLQWTGRTTHNRIVNFNIDRRPAAVPENLTGQLVQVHIESALAHSLRGVFHPEDIPTKADVKGEDSYAA